MRVLIFNAVLCSYAHDINSALGGKVANKKMTSLAPQFELQAEHNAEEYSILSFLKNEEDKMEEGTPQNVMCDKLSAILLKKVPSSWCAQRARRAAAVTLAEEEALGQKSGKSGKGSKARGGKAATYMPAPSPAADVAAVYGVAIRDGVDLTPLGLDGFPEEIYASSLDQHLYALWMVGVRGAEALQYLQFGKQTLKLLVRLPLI